MWGDFSVISDNERSRSPHRSLERTPPEVQQDKLDMIERGAELRAKELEINFKPKKEHSVLSVCAEFITSVVF